MLPSTSHLFRSILAKKSGIGEGNFYLYFHDKSLFNWLLAERQNAIGIFLMYNQSGGEDFESRNWDYVVGV